MHFNASHELAVSFGSSVCNPARLIKNCIVYKIEFIGEPRLLYCSNFFPTSLVNMGSDPAVSRPRIRIVDSAFA